jgi:predicted dehydrogenase
MWRRCGTSWNSCAPVNVVFVAKHPIPVGVVGVGSLGRHHARLYADLPQACLVGVVDIDRKRAEAIATEYGCEVFPDTESLLGRVVAASVAVPTGHHRDVAETLLGGGVDVLVEKPLASTIEDSRAIVELAESRSRRLMVGHIERFNPAVAALIAAVSNPKFFEIHRLAAFTERSTDIDVVLDLMIHDLDLLLHLDGGEVESVEASGVSALTDKLDIANARIRMQSGCVANITASRISTDTLRRVRVFQAETYFACDAGERRLERYRLLPGKPRARIDRERIAVGDEEPLRLELESFLQSVERKSAPPVDGRAALRVMELACRVREAIEAG